MTVLFGGSGGEAVVAHSHESFRQNVKTPPPDEFKDGEFEDGGFSGGAVGPFEEDVASGVVAEDALGTEGAALDVASEVTEGGFSAANGLKLDVPLGSGSEGLVLGQGQLLVEFRVLALEGALDETAEAGGEGTVVDEEIVGLFGAMEALVFRVKGDGGNDDVDVGMVLGLAAPGVEDGGEVKLKLIVFELGTGNVMQGGGAAFEEKMVEDSGLVEAEGAQLRRDGEGDHEVRGPQEFCLLFGGPLLLVTGSALGAVAMIAGVVGVVSFAAAGVAALIEPTTEFGRPAREDAPDRPVVDSGKTGRVSTGIGRPVLTQDVCEGKGHLVLRRWLV